MSRQRQTVAELKASGCRHYSKDQLEARERNEVRPPVSTVSPPAYLPNSLKGKFSQIAAVLVPLGLLSELDADVLARYLIAEANYLQVTTRLQTSMNSGNLQDASTLSAMQDRFFRQCRAAAADLHLTVSSRCCITLPDGTRVEPAAEGADLFGD